MKTEEERLAEILLSDMSITMPNESAYERRVTGRKAAIVAVQFIIDDIIRTINEVDNETALTLLVLQKNRYIEVKNQLEE